MKLQNKIRKWSDYKLSEWDSQYIAENVLKLYVLKPKAKNFKKGDLNERKNVSSTSCTKSRNNS